MSLLEQRRRGRGSELTNESLVLHSVPSRRSPSSGHPLNWHKATNNHQSSETLSTKSPASLNSTIVEEEGRPSFSNLRAEGWYQLPPEQPPTAGWISGFDDQSCEAFDNKSNEASVESYPAFLLLTSHLLCWQPRCAQRVKWLRHCPATFTRFGTMCVSSQTTSLIPIGSAVVQNERVRSRDQPHCRGSDKSGYSYFLIVWYNKGSALWELPI